MSTACDSGEVDSVVAVEAGGSLPYAGDCPTNDFAERECNSDGEVNPMPIEAKNCGDEEREKEEKKGKEVVDMEKEKGDLRRKKRDRKEGERTKERKREKKKDELGYHF